MHLWQKKKENLGEGVCLNLWWEWALMKAKKIALFWFVTQFGSGIKGGVMGPCTPAMSANGAPGVALTGQDPVDLHTVSESARDRWSDRYPNSSSLFEARSLEISYN